MWYRVVQTYGKSYVGYVEAESVEEVKEKLENYEVDMEEYDDQYLFAQSIQQYQGEEDEISSAEEAAECSMDDFEEVDGFNNERGC